MQAEQLRGAVTVNSPWTNVHAGAEFVLAVPLRRLSSESTAQSAATPATAPLPEFEAGLSVLVADDVLLNRRVLRRAFTTHFGAGWTVQEASTAEEALAALATGHGHALLVIDEILSDERDALRGSEAVRLLREREAAEGLPRLPIISCTGNAAHDSARILEHGADAAWGKPFPSFTDGSMQREVARLLNSRR